MMNSLRSFLREPLLHFLLAGAALFLLYSVVATKSSVGDDEIIVTTGHVEHLTTLFLKTRQRLPTDNELAGLVDDFIVEEILYREAKKMGLDQNDTIIRRRLRQKMEFLFDDFATAEPTDEELTTFVAGDPGRYRTDDRITFEHIYLSDGSREEALTLLENLQSGADMETAAAQFSGLLPSNFVNARKSEVAAQLGQTFSEQIFVLDTDKWTGPVESPFGIHLVFVNAVVPGSAPALDEVRAAVKRDWLAARQAEAEREILQQLRDRYRVTIEEFDGDSP